MSRKRALPALPERGSSELDVASIEQIERQVAETLPMIDDLDVLDEWRARAAALAEYLRGRDLQGPMLGAQRRVEARIGQLLGKTTKGARTDLDARVKVPLDRPGDRHDFRLLARALDDELALDEEEWRQSRRALVALVRDRLPDPPPASVVSADVRRRRELRSAFGARLRALQDDARWLARRVERTSALAPESEVDRWLVALDEVAADLKAMRDELLNKEVPTGLLSRKQPTKRRRRKPDREQIEFGNTLRAMVLCARYVSFKLGYRTSEQRDQVESLIDADDETLREWREGIRAIDDAARQLRRRIG